MSAGISLRRLHPRFGGLMPPPGRMDGRWSPFYSHFVIYCRIVLTPPPLGLYAARNLRALLDWPTQDKWFLMGNIMPSQIKIRGIGTSACAFGLVMAGGAVHAQLDPVDPIPLCSKTITLHQTTDSGSGFCEVSFKRCDSHYTCDSGTMYATCGTATYVDGYCQRFTDGWTDPETGACLYGIPDGPPVRSKSISGFTGMQSCGLY